MHIPIWFGYDEYEPGQKEKTQVEFANLEKEAGFSSSKVACYAYKL